MSEAQTTAGIPARNQEKSYDAIEFLLILGKRKKLVFGLPFVAGLLAAGISMLIPNTYKATTKILPPQQTQAGAAAILSQLGGVAGAAAGAAGIKNPNDLYIGMLKSRTIADNLIAQFDLKKVYDRDTGEKTRRELADNTIVTSGKDNLITVEVEDHKADRSAEIANAYVAELLKLTKKIAVTEASQRRLFFQTQLETSKNNLAEAEIALKKALGTHGVISVDTESRTIVETVAQLRAKVAAKEIQLNSMQPFVTIHNQDYKRLQQEVVSMKAELARLENGDEARKTDRSGSFSGLENMKTLRELKYHQMLYELLSKQFEVARLDEAKDASIVQVLDKAMEPEQKIKPRRAIIVLLTMIVAFIGAIIYANFVERWKGMFREPEQASRLNQMKSSWRLK